MSSMLRRSSRSNIVTHIIGFDGETDMHGTTVAFVDLNCVGTLMDSLSRSRSTIVADLHSFMHVDEGYGRIMPDTFGGVGTNGGAFDLIFGGQYSLNYCIK